MRRHIWLVLIALLVAAPVIIWWHTNRQTKTVESGGTVIKLVNRPVKFCPATAELVITAGVPEKTIFDREVSVRNCDNIPLDPASVNVKTNFSFYIRLSEVRAARIVATGPITAPLEYSLQIGDLTNDNTIDRSDLAVVETALSSGDYSASADVDKDGKLTITDYSLVNLNQGAGVERPDGAAWKPRQ